MVRFTMANLMMQDDEQTVTRINEDWECIAALREQLRQNKIEKKASTLLWDKKIQEGERLRKRLALAGSYKGSFEVMSEGYARLREEITTLTEQLASANEKKERYWHWLNIMPSQRVKTQLEGKS